MLPSVSLMNSRQAVRLLGGNMIRLIDVKLTLGAGVYTALHRCVFARDLRNCVSFLCGFCEFLNGICFMKQWIMTF